MCGMVLRVEARCEALKRYFYDIMGIPANAIVTNIDIEKGRKYVQAIRKADEYLTMREQDIALAAYVAGYSEAMGGAAWTLSDSSRQDLNF